MLPLCPLRQGRSRAQKKEYIQYQKEYIQYQTGTAPFGAVPVCLFCPVRAERGCAPAVQEGMVSSSAAGRGMMVLGGGRFAAPETFRNKVNVSFFKIL